jgi:hypothetical protein
MLQPEGFSSDLLVPCPPATVPSRITDISGLGSTSVGLLHSSGHLLQTHFGNMSRDVEKLLELKGMLSRDKVCKETAIKEFDLEVR